jgi:mRNA interferase MazF
VAGVLRGAIVWADPDPVRGHEQGGRRPFLVLSNQRLNESSGTVIAVAITSQPPRAGYPFTYHLPSGTLPRDSWVKLTQIRTLATERLGAQIAQIADADFEPILAGLLEHLT